MTKLKSLRSELLIVAGFLILPLLLFGAVSLGGRTMLPVDNLYQWAPWASAAGEFQAEIPHNGLLSDLILENYAWKRFINNSLAEGTLPLWNPYIFAGTPFLATGQHSAYYPFSLLFMVLPLTTAYGWFTVSQLWLAGTLAYVLARVLGQRPTGAAVAGLVFQGCGFLLVSAAVFPMILAAVVWLPLLLAAVEKVIHHTSPAGHRRWTLPWATVGAIGLGCQVLAGHIEITYYTLLVMAFFAAWRLIATARQSVAAQSHGWFGLSLLRPAVWLLGMVAVGLMLGAVQFVPFVEVGRANFREGSASLQEIRGWAFPARRIVTLAVPDFYGNPADHNYRDVFSGRVVPFTTNYYGEVNPHGAYTSNWGIKNYVEGGIYLGILPLMLAGLGIWAAVGRFRHRRSVTAFFATLSLLSLSFIFGTPLYALLYYGLPGINQLHSPFRWVFPLSLSIAILAGFGMDYLAAGREDLARPPKSVVRSLVTLRSAAWSPAGVLAGLSFWAGLLLLALLFLSRVFYTQVEPIVNRLFLGLAQAPDAFADGRAFFSYQFWQFLFLGLMLLVAGLVLRLSTSRRPVWPWLAVIVIGLDLLVVGYDFRAAAKPELLNYQPELVEWLKQQPGLWRLTTFAPHGDKPLNANTPWHDDLQDVRGYDSVILKQYTDYMTAIEPQNELQFNRVQPIANWESLNSPLLDLLGVRYIVTAETVDLPKLQAAWQGEGLRVYENLAAVPRAYTIPLAATAVVDDALAGMQRQDPRQFVFVETADWPRSLPAPATAQELAAAEVTAYGSIEVTVEAAVDQPSWLILNDTYFQGWDVFVRAVDPGTGEAGEESQGELYRVNGNFRGVQLEAGQWQVRFRYSPLSFKVGGLASFMAGIVLVFAAAVWAWRQLYRPQGELTNTRSIAKNSLAPMALNLFNRAIDFAFAAFYLRLLGPANSGSYATAIIIAGWYEIIANFGLNTLVIREVARDKSQASRYLLNTTILRLGIGIVATMPVLVYMAGVRLTGNPLDAETTLAIVLLMIGMVFSGMGQGLAGLYYAYESAEFPAAVTTITTILKVAFGVLALLMGYSFVGLAAVSIVVNIITLLILVISAFRHFRLPGPWQMDWSLQRRMVGQSYPLMLNHLLAVIFFQIDIPLLRQFNGEAVVGWYNSAYKWVNAFNVIPSFFTFALFPVISRQVHSSVFDARRTFRMSIKLMVLLALPLAAVTTLLAPILIGVLGGREFLPHGAIALQLIIWSIPIGWMNSVTNYVLISLGVERKLTGAFVIGVSFNIILNLILLPRFSYLAASITTILSEVVLLLLFARYLKPVMPEVRWLNLLIKPLAVTAAMLGAMVLGSQISMVVGLVLGVGVYPLGLWLLRAFGEEERFILSSLLPGRVADRLRLKPTGIQE